MLRWKKWALLLALVTAVVAAPAARANPHGRGGYYRPYGGGYYRPYYGGYYGGYYRYPSVGVVIVPRPVVVAPAPVIVTSPPIAAPAPSYLSPVPPLAPDQLRVAPVPEPLVPMVP